MGMENHRTHMNMTLTGPVLCDGLSAEWIGEGRWRDMAAKILS